MWHLFDRYKGVVWPKARQLNLIAKILNNLCEGTGIKLDTPTVPSPAAPVTISIDTEWLDEYIGEIPSGGGGGGMFAWDPATKTIGAGGVMVGRKFVMATGTGTANVQDGTYLCKVTLGTSPTVEVVASPTVGLIPGPSGNISYIPIYTIDGGRISQDYRGAFVVVAYE